MQLYKLIGTDGREYGPADADVVRQWIRENRVERQTPVFAPGSADWTFVGLLPEFANDFSGTLPPPIAPIAPLPPTPVPVPYLAKSESLAKAGMVCGILSVTIGCCCGGAPFNFLGMIFSLLALVQISENPQRYGGRGMAIVGLILSLCGFVIFALLILAH
jgi:hypothetical protein